jgi:hypothetical protein
MTSGRILLSGSRAKNKKVSLAGKTFCPERNNIVVHEIISGWI